MWASIVAWVLGKAWPWIWHAVRRFGSWLFIAALVVIIGMKWFGFKKNIYNLGYKQGYSQALTDHPSNTVASGGTVNYYTYGDKGGWFDIKLLRFIRIVIVPAK